MKLEDQSAAQEVLQVEMEWVQALKELDFETMRRILADDYTQITASGNVIGKQEFLASFEGEQRMWDHAQSSDHHIRIYKETAVMVALWNARGVNHGQKFDYQARFLAVYINHDGRWQLAADQSTPIKD
jgi:uncharacterized protein (TIGR02246 family)